MPPSAGCIEGGATPSREDKLGELEEEDEEEEVEVKARLAAEVCTVDGAPYVAAGVLGGNSDLLSNADPENPAAKPNLRAKAKASAGVNATEDTLEVLWAFISLSFLLANKIAGRVDTNDIRPSGPRSE